MAGLGSQLPLRLKIATTALKMSAPAKTDNGLKGNRFPDFTNGGFKGRSINQGAAPALGGSEPIVIDAAGCADGCKASRADVWLWFT